ncbi:hypothetical protein VTN00DRAFT_6188 [Thermoascus crustaceus]|uniref:uncharacterized protein n=1 Tax=Thermoascus crustaceus TaxID=5088 RepID=UPI0037431C85
MTDYNKWKVVDLKAEVKRRGIPSTGLKVKQNYIDRLLESDAQGESGSASEDAALAEDTPEQSGQAEESSSGEQNNESGAQQSNDDPDDPQPPSQHEELYTAPQETEGAVEGGSSPKETQKSGNSGEEAEGNHAENEARSEAGNKATEEPAEQSAEQPAEEPAQPGEQQAEQPVEQRTEEAPALPEQAMQEPSEPAQGALEQRERAGEAPVSAEPAPPPSLNPEPSTASAAEEVIDDTRKRKRRSPSPLPDPEAIAQKRAKAVDGSPRVLMKEDVGAENLPQRPAGEDDISRPDETQGLSPRHEADSRREEEMTDAERPQEDVEARHISISQAENADREVHPPPSRQDARFKDLFPSANQEQMRRMSPAPDGDMDVDEDRVVEAALHPATSALYIRDFMRPLQPASLKKYLASLASPPGTSPDPDIILDFFIDSIKTHCFVNFSNVSAASRVRSALHGTVWPNERDRKPLWVDFVPEEKLREWIEIEQQSESRGRGGPRWEVIYDETEDGVKAVLQEARPTNGRGRDMGPDVPRGPRGSFADRDDQRGSQASGGPRSRQQGQGFKALDDLFMSTNAKPKLYYLPVPREVAERRLDRFAELARHGPYPRRGGDEMRRITFEDTDFFVDKGPEYGGPRGRRGRGRGGGAWRDNWRGRRY